MMQHHDALSRAEEIVSELESIFRANRDPLRVIELERVRMLLLELSGCLQSLRAGRTPEKSDQHLIKRLVKSLIMYLLKSGVIADLAEFVKDMLMNQ